MVYANNLPKEEEKIVVNPSFVWYNEWSTSDIVIDSVTIDVWQDNNVGVLQYIVQPGDVLSKIASMFGTTVTNIQKVNKLNGPIKPGQKLVITNDDDGFLYAIPQNINIVVFVNKYSLNKDDFMTLNYIQDESEILYQWQDVFLNITKEQAYDNGLLERPKPVIVIKPTNAYKPTINKPVVKKPVVSSSSSDDDTPATPAKKSTVISQWVFKKDIKNSFYPGYCTWYAAIISPEIFPYSSENKQERLFWGNAREWCTNAKKAGFRVGSKPAVGALIVYKKWWRLVSAGHVGKVINYYPDDGKMIIRDMNRIAKFIVTERREETSNSNISCYIYPGK